MNPLPGDFDTLCLRRGEDGQISQRPADEASEAGTPHQKFILSCASSVRCVLCVVVARDRCESLHADVCC